MRRRQIQVARQEVAAQAARVQSVLDEALARGRPFNPGWQERLERTALMKPPSDHEACPLCGRRKVGRPKR